MGVMDDGDDVDKQRSMNSELQGWIGGREKKKHEERKEEAGETKKKHEELKEEEKFSLADRSRFVMVYRWQIILLLYAW